MIAKKNTEWLDLSTGISPWAWPVPDLPSSVWHQLPPPNTALLTAAAQYYKVDIGCIVATPGSQLPIRLIPQLLSPAKVAIPTLGYQEHARSWQLANHELVYYSSTEQLLHFLSQKTIEHAVIINPNNPSTELIPQETMIQIEAQTPGIVVLDEAFIDACASLTPSEEPDHWLYESGLSKNTIRLRSLGKFFGLAGLRVGFAIGKHEILEQLDSLLQPWPISHASLIIAESALSDSLWQEQQVQKIAAQSKRFSQVLEKLIDKRLTHFEIKHAGLFSTVFAEQTELFTLHQQLAQLGIWTRLHNLGDSPAWLRFGLPQDIKQFCKQSQSLIV